MKTAIIHLLVFLLSRLSREPMLYTIRFLPAIQSRHDTRGRSVSEYETLADALSAFKSLKSEHAKRKEKIHGTYYLSIESRSHHFDHIPTRHQGQGAQVDLEDVIEDAKDAIARAKDPVHAGVSGAGQDGPVSARTGSGAVAVEEKAAGSGKAAEPAVRMKLADLGRRE